MGPGGDRLVRTRLGREAVAEVGLVEGVNALVLLRVPGQSVMVLLLGADVIGKVGPCTGCGWPQCRRQRE